MVIYLLTDSIWNRELRQVCLNNYKLKSQIRGHLFLIRTVYRTEKKCLFSYGLGTGAFI